MKSKKYISGIGFLLLFLMLCKATAFHVYTHQDEPTDTIENCSICDLAIENQDAESNLPPTVSDTLSIFLWPDSENIFKATSRFEGDLYPCRYCCRPPPSLV